MLRTSQNAVKAKFGLPQRPVPEGMLCVVVIIRPVGIIGLMYTG